VRAHLPPPYWLALLVLLAAACAPSPEPVDQASLPPLEQALCDQADLARLMPASLRAAVSAARRSDALAMTTAANNVNQDASRIFFVLAPLAVGLSRSDPRLPVIVHLTSIANLGQQGALLFLAGGVPNSSSVDSIEESIGPVEHEVASLDDAMGAIGLEGC